MTTRETDPAPVVLRPAERADLLDVYRLEQRCFPSPWPYQAFLAHLDAPAFLLALVDSEIVGYIVADIRDGFPGPAGHIKDLAVAPDHRRTGIGSRLLDAGLARLENAGAVYVSLEVREGNEAAQALYRAFGFSAERTETGYYADGTDAVVMSRQLDR